MDFFMYTKDHTNIYFPYDTSDLLLKSGKMLDVI